MSTVFIGALLLDEMKLSPYLSLDKTTLNILGFTDLGQYTPETYKNVPGDHGLVLLYQPISGKWTQPIAAFLSKNAASGDILAQILLEGIVLLENAGFSVDCVVSDGATWNRSMWTQFGANADNPKCPHPCDSDRPLFFVSDFPHLIKNLRNWLLNKSEIKVNNSLI